MDQPSHPPTVGRRQPTVDYYELFGLEPSFRLDVDDLGRRYLELSKEVHPDRFVNAPPRERLVALQRSMQLNDAYKTLKKPIPRAEYLLAREGITIGANENLGPQFLMEIMELREELQQAKLAGESGRLQELEERMLDRRDAVLGRVGELFDTIKGDASGAGAGADRAQVLANVKQKLIELRYIMRYLDELEDEDFE